MYDHETWFLESFFVYESKNEVKEIIKPIFIGDFHSNQKSILIFHDFERKMHIFDDFSSFSQPKTNVKRF